MPITKAAKKAVKNSGNKRVFNIRRMRKVRESVKKINDLLHQNKNDEAQKELPKAYKALDKAAKSHTLNKNTVNRKKSKLSARIKKAIKS